MSRKILNAALIYVLALATFFGLAAIRDDDSVTRINAAGLCEVRVREAGVQKWVVKPSSWCQPEPDTTPVSTSTPTTGVPTPTSTFVAPTATTAPPTATVGQYPLFDTSRIPERNEPGTQQSNRSMQLDS